MDPCPRSCPRPVWTFLHNILKLITPTTTPGSIVGPVPMQCEYTIRRFPCDDQYIWCDRHIRCFNNINFNIPQNVQIRNCTRWNVLNNLSSNVFAINSLQWQESIPVGYVPPTYVVWKGKVSMVYPTPLDTLPLPQIPSPRYPTPKIPTPGCPVHSKLYLWLLYPIDTLPYNPPRYRTPWKRHGTRDTLQPLWTDWQMPVKTLHSRNYCYRR